MACGNIKTMTILILKAYGPRIIHSLIGALFDYVYLKLAMYITRIKDPYFWVRNIKNWRSKI